MIHHAARSVVRRRAAACGAWRLVAFSAGSGEWRTWRAPREVGTMLGRTVLPLARGPDELVIRVANTPMWPMPRLSGSAAWEKAHPHKALGIATALKGTRARVVY
jgi:hypothetical protein